MTYSLDFRENVLRHIEMGSTIETVSKLFSIGTTTLKNWKRLRAHPGKLEGQGCRCNPYKIDAEALTSYIRERPDAFMWMSPEWILSYPEIMHGRKEAFL